MSESNPTLEKANQALGGKNIPRDSFHNLGDSVVGVTVHRRPNKNYNSLDMVTVSVYTTVSGSLEGHRLIVRSSETQQILGFGQYFNRHHKGVFEFNFYDVPQGVDCCVNFD